MICKTCGKEYHYCCSCGCDGVLEYGYCSETCMSNSPELEELYTTIDFISNAMHEYKIPKDKLIKLLESYEQFGYILEGYLRS